MINKVGVKIDPKQAISIQMGNTLPDILPLLQRGITEEKSPNNRPENIQKICLSISIGVSEEKEQPLCKNE